MSWRLRSIAAGALDLPAAEHKTLIVLADFARDDGLCWPSRGAIEQITGLSSATVKRAVRGLGARGLITNTGRRRMACPVRQVVVKKLIESDRLADHRRVTSEPPKGSPMIPGGVTSEPPKGSPVSQRGVTHDPQSPLGSTPRTLTPPNPPADQKAAAPERGEGETDQVESLIEKLKAKALLDGWTPTRNDRTTLSALVRDVDASRLWSLAGSMLGYRTHPVSALVSLVERPKSPRGAPLSAAAELTVGGAQAETVEPVPDRAAAQAALAERLARQIEVSFVDDEGNPMAMVSRDDALAWRPVREALATHLAPANFAAVIAPLHHLLTVSDDGGVTIHLDGDPFVLDTLRDRYSAEQLNDIASSITPPRPRRIRLHSAGLEGQRA